MIGLWGWFDVCLGVCFGFLGGCLVECFGKGVGCDLEFRFLVL